MNVFKKMVLIPDTEYAKLKNQGEQKDLEEKSVNLIDNDKQGEDEENNRDVILNPHIEEFADQNITKSEIKTFQAPSDFQNNLVQEIEKYKKKKKPKKLKIKSIPYEKLKWETLKKF